VRRKWEDVRRYLSTIRRLVEPATDLKVTWSWSNIWTQVKDKNIQKATDAMKALNDESTNLLASLKTHMQLNHSQFEPTSNNHSFRTVQDSSHQNQDSFRSNHNSKGANQIRTKPPYQPKGINGLPIPPKDKGNDPAHQDQTSCMLCGEHSSHHYSHCRRREQINGNPKLVDLNKQKGTYAWISTQEAVCYNYQSKRGCSAGDSCARQKTGHCCSLCNQRGHGAHLCPN